MSPSAHKKFHRFLIRFFSMATLIFVPVAIAAGFMANGIFSAAKQEMATDVERDARIVSTQELRIFWGIRNILLGVSDFAEVKNQNNMRDCSNTMAVLMENINAPAKLLINLGVADFNGNVICSALPLTGPVNISDRDYFKRAIANRDFTFGEYQTGRVTGRPSLNFGYPVMNDVGSVDSVVFAALDLNALNDTIAQAGIPGGTSLAVTDDNDKILVAFPQSGGLIGQTWGQNVLDKLGHYDEGSTEDRDIYGTPSILGVSKIELPNQSGHLHVIVGVSLAVLFKDASFRLSLGMILLILSVLVAAVCGWFLGGRIIKHLSLPD